MGNARQCDVIGHNALIKHFLPGYGFEFGENVFSLGGLRNIFCKLMLAH